MTASRRAAVSPRRRWELASMLGPSAFGLVAFTLVPAGFVAVWSFTHFDIGSAPRFVGLQNYRFAAYTDVFLHQAIGNTLWMIAVGLPVQVVIALSLATLLTRRDRITTVARTAVFLPSIIPPVAATLAFGWLLQPGQGPVDHLLGALHLPQPLWFYDPQWAKPGLVLLALWGVGPVVIMYIAGLVRIPRRLYEAAMLEGASRWQQFRKITLPMLMPVLLFTVVLGIVGYLQYFTQACIAASTASPGIDALNGEPDGSTRFYAGVMFEQAFRLGNFGYAAMLAFVLFVVALVAMAALLVIARRLASADPTRR